MNPGADDGSHPRKRGAHRRLLAKAMPLEHVVSDGTKTDCFDYALSGGFHRPRSQRPAVEFVDDAGMVRWHERPREDTDPLLWFQWDLDERKSVWNRWPVEVWPEAVVSYLGRVPTRPWEFLKWAADAAGVERAELRDALASGNCVVVRDAHHWFGEFLRQHYPQEATHWELLSIRDLPIEQYELRSEEGRAEGRGVLIDTGRDPRMRRVLRTRRILCVVSLASGHHLSRTLRETYPDAAGRPVLLAWTARLPKGGDKEALGPLLASLGRACTLYMKVRSEETTGEQLAEELARLASGVWRAHSMRNVKGVLVSKGDKEQIDEIEAAAKSAGWQAIVEYDIFRLKSQLSQYVRWRMERAAYSIRQEARDRAEHEVSSATASGGNGQDERANDELLENVGTPDPAFDRALSRAGLEQVLESLGGETVLTGTVKALLEEERRDPAATAPTLIRRVARRCGVPEATVRKRIQRAVRKGRQET